MVINEFERKERESEEDEERLNFGQTRMEKVKM